MRGRRADAAQEVPPTMTSEIPHEEWVARLDAFGRRHAGWIVELEVFGSGLGDQVESGRLPLVGIAADVKTRAPSIEIALGGRPDAHVTRIVADARRVWLAEAGETTLEALAIESGDGTTTIVRFQRIAPRLGERQLPEP
jgi:hypothetical protein